MENNAYTDSHPALTLGDIKDIIERSWRTGEMPVEKPDLTSEHEKYISKTSFLKSCICMIGKCCRRWKRLGFIRI
jgi:hypothetical protein